LDIQSILHAGMPSMADSRTTVALSELRDAIDFVSFGEVGEHSAYICRATGKIYWVTGDSSLDEEEDLPDDLEASDRYIAVPHKKELDLGRRLALRFARRELPDDCETIAGFFRRRGAYARFKDLLERRGMLSRWYEHGEMATGEALLVWCDDVGLAVRP
jgi:hypothetical protein